MKTYISYITAPFMLLVWSWPPPIFAPKMLPFTTSALCSRLAVGIQLVHKCSPPPFPGGYMADRGRGVCVQGIVLPLWGLIAAIVSELPVAIVESCSLVYLCVLLHGRQALLFLPYMEGGRVCVSRGWGKGWAQHPHSIRFWVHISVL